MPEAVDSDKMPRSRAASDLTRYEGPELKKRVDDAFLKAIPEINPVGIGALAGALDYNNLSWPAKMIMKSKRAPQGDFRDWKAIRAWAEKSMFANPSLLTQQP